MWTISKLFLILDVFFTSLIDHCNYLYNYFILWIYILIITGNIFNGSYFFYTRTYNAFIFISICLYHLESKHLFMRRNIRKKTILLKSNLIYILLKEIWFRYFFKINFKMMSNKWPPLDLWVQNWIDRGFHYKWLTMYTSVLSIIRCWGLIYIYYYIPHDNEEYDIFYNYDQVINVRDKSFQTIYYYLNYIFSSVFSCNLVHISVSIRI